MSHVQPLTKPNHILPSYFRPEKRATVLLAHGPFVDFPLDHPQAGGVLGDTDDAAAIAAAAAATAAAAEVGGPEIGGGHVCRACGGPRFGRITCAGCGANAHSWKAGVDAGGVA